MVMVKVCGVDCSSGYCFWFVPVTWQLYLAISLQLPGQSHVSSFGY